ncbi:DUF262 domain-containing protein [Photobacterium rosenbergii]|uniref:DUF262 domain-containing protein n=1 Tax=Photobacterium rosenbergii TaxID=294936 RepID=UPI001C99D0DD|nr:DUF262 domain-containing protein [Photobacterium rosenbergii]MBY5948345.1 DUF262 domain-containing protein [Photobacterium rosenbergii]
MSVKQTFWHLLDDYSIEVPIIQRDYAQGREGAKEQQIRQSFVQTLHEMVIHTDRSQDLDFVYGSLKKDKLVLLDGQQRLTTLFLLHWYIAAGTGVIEEVKPKLDKFNYETRISSREFIQSLIANSHGLIGTVSDKSLSEKIIDTHWFFSVWQNDPTVQSMLTMLDEIDRVFKSDLEQGVSLWQQLVCNDHPPITFHFLEMQEFALTDELYIKMNARGRPLTEFENFKAWLQSYVDKSDDIVIPDTFWAAMDKEWTDVFWRMRQKGEYEVDGLFLTIFKSVAQYNIAGRVTLAGSKLAAGDEKIITALHNNTFVSSTEYDVHRCFKDNTLNIIGDLFNLISYLQSPEGEASIPALAKQCDTIIKGMLRSKGYYEQTRFSALLSFIRQRESGTYWDVDELKELTDWLGVTTRLINNTQSDIVNYVRAVHALHEMCKLIGDGCFIHRLLDTEPTAIPFFNEIQKKEEILKAKLVVEDPSWHPLLRKFENNEYFYGQIGFLLKGSLDSISGQYNKEAFNSLSNKADKLFQKEQVEADDFLLQRALLSTGNYLVNARKGNLSFCTAHPNDRNENWRRVFNDGKGCEILFKLLGSLEEGNERQGLMELVQSVEGQGWRQYFIDYPEAIAACRKRKVRMYFENEVYLLNGEQMNSWHSDVRTFVLFNKLKKETSSDLLALQEKLQKYDYAKTEDKYPGIIVEPWQGGTLRVEYRECRFKISLYVNGDETPVEGCKEITALRGIIKKLTKKEGAPSHIEML